MSKFLSIKQIINHCRTTAKDFVGKPEAFWDSLRANPNIERPEQAIAFLSNPKMQTGDVAAIREILETGKTSFQSAADDREEVLALRAKVAKLEQSSKLGRDVVALASSPVAAVSKPIVAGLSKSLAAQAKVAKSAAFEQIVSKRAANTMSRDEFDSLTHHEQSAFSLSGGRISDPAVEKVAPAPIKPGSTLVTREQFNGLSAKAKSEFCLAGGKIS